MKVMIVGLGSIGRRHLEIIKKLYPTTEIYVYRSKAIKENENMEMVKYLYNLEEAFEYKPDMAFITNPTSLHVDMAILAAKNSCHLFIEKPLSNELDNVEKLIEIVNRKKLITLMGCNMRFNPIIITLKKHVEENLFGKIFSFSINCGSYLPNWRPSHDYTKSYSASKSLGGGVVLDLIHEIDYAKWIFGDFVEIRSKIGNISNLKIETEDYADILLKTNRDINGRIHLDYYRRVPERKIEILFEDGIIIGDLVNNTITTLSDKTNKVLKFDFERNHMYEEQIKYFFDSVSSNQKTFNDIEEGYSVLKLALEIKEKGLK